MNTDPNVVGHVSEETKEKWDSRIALLLEREIDLTERELEFVESLQLQRSHEKILSSPQVKWLYDMFNRVGG